MAAIRMGDFCHDLTSAMTAIVGTIQRTTHRQGQWCRSCERADCPDFKAVKLALEPGQVPTLSLPCGHCHRRFFGKACYSAHKVSSSSKYRPLCDFKKKCLQCHKVCETSLKRAKRGGDRKSVKFNHKCGWGECPFCEIQVELASHQCFIQPVDPEDDEPKLHKVFASEVGSRTVVRVDEDGDMWVEYPPPLFVFADFEAITDEGVQTPILLCLEDEGHHTPLW